MRGWKAESYSPATKTLYRTLRKGTRTLHVHRDCGSFLLVLQRIAESLKKPCWKSAQEVVNYGQQLLSGHALCAPSHVAPSSWLVLVGSLSLIIMTPTSWYYFGPEYSTAYPPASILHSGWPFRFYSSSSHSTSGTGKSGVYFRL